MAEKRQAESPRAEGSSRARSGELVRRRDPFETFGVGPVGLMRRMQEDFDRLFAGFGGSRWPSLFREHGEWVPEIEAFQRGNEFVVRADVPGLSKDDISVEVGDDTLTISGERKYDHEEEREGVFRSERSYGSFTRVVPLPDGAVTDSAKANFKDGVLEITMQAPSEEVRRGRRIEIGQGSTEKATQR